MRRWDENGAMCRYFDSRGHIAGRIVHVYYANVFVAYHQGVMIGEFYSWDDAMSAVERANDFV